MAEQNFIDFVKICCRSGAGGSGSSHFLRDKHNNMGGPDGGNGGRGGHIILRGNNNVWTLLNLKYRKHIIATAGQNGAGRLCSGSDGEDVILDVPLGTVAKDPDTGVVICEITTHGQEIILTSGGRGGKGNAYFKSSTNQAPDFAQTGEPGKEEWRILELKTLADVGLVGFPNAGKSSLLASITAAKPEIANYPFTTLTPNLGIVKYRDHKSFVMADIPGIIEHAHLGKGLGLRFLRHIERNAVLLFLIPSDSDNISNQYRILLNELEMYNPELMDKPRILAITKTDLIDDELKVWIENELDIDIPHIFISSVTGYGLTELKDVLWHTITTS